MRFLRLSYLRDTEGAVAVEGAVLFPLLAFIGYGIVDLSMMLLQTHKMEQGLVAGASYLARAQAPALLTAQAKNIAVSGRPDGSGEPRVDGWTDAEITLTIRNIPNNGQYRAEAVVQVAEFASAHPYQGLGLIKLASGGRITIRTDHEERLVRSR